LTAHRQGLPEIPDVDPSFARAWVKEWVPRVRSCALENEGEPWLLLADEWFTRGGVDVPGRGFYSRSWAQLENGVGLLRRFLEHSGRFLRGPKAKNFAGRRVLVLTGASFAPTLNRVLAELNRRTGSQVRALAAQNFSFGSTVTVAGLLCGKDLLYTAHADREAHGGDPNWVDAVVVPSSSLRTHMGPTDQYTLQGADEVCSETLFLDDMTLAALQEQLGLPVVPSGENLSQTLDHLKTAERASMDWHLGGMTQPQGAYLP
jgi:NifB/MoaA-like Fe-S oxidoreductase